VQGGHTPYIKLVGYDSADVRSIRAFPSKSEISTLSLSHPCARCFSTP